MDRDHTDGYLIGKGFLGWKTCTIANSRALLDMHSPEYLRNLSLVA
jgi:hypothetical protein